MMTSLKGPPTGKVRVNFDMPREEYERFREFCAKADTDVSKAFRSLARRAMDRNQDSLGDTLVHEKGAGDIADPEMPEPEDCRRDDTENVA